MRETGSLSAEGSVHENPVGDDATARPENSIPAAAATAGNRILAASAGDPVLRSAAWRAPVRGSMRPVASPLADSGFAPAADAGASFALCFRRPMRRRVPRTLITSTPGG